MAISLSTPQRHQTNDDVRLRDTGILHPAIYDKMPKLYRKLDTQIGLIVY